MKQVLQRLGTGDIQVIDAPAPVAGRNSIVVATTATVISAGTERMLLQFGKSGWLAKARSQPDKVKQVLEKIRTDGIGPTLDAVRSKLDNPIPLGYCHAGVVIEVGAGVTQFTIGDRVATNGPHAQYVAVPATLAARIPDNVSDEAAAFSALAAIALQGVRLAQPTLGESVVVYGLGLIGLTAVQLLRANGCQVIGIDRDAARCALAEQFGAVCVHADDSVAAVLQLTRGRGADAVLLTLATDSNEPVHSAAEMCRKRGRLVLVGVTGLELRRDDFYKKELSFAVSCSYGPGRYDAAYESGHDYPVGFVRWTAQRNFEAVLDLAADGRFDPLPLITHRYAIDDAQSAYDIVAGAEPSLAILLTYPEVRQQAPARIVRAAPPRRAKPSIAVIGAGNFATRTLIPVLKESGARLHTIVTTSGSTAAVAAGKFGFEFASSNLDDVFANDEIDTVFVLTRHDTHAQLGLRAIQAGKHVFVEKPLALQEADVDNIEAALATSNVQLMIGYNRRYAPLTAQLQQLVQKRSGPLTTIMTINAGAIPLDHWTQHPEQGGGRLVGEATHFIDLARALTGAPIVDASVTPSHDTAGNVIDDVAHISVRFADGSTALIHYLANGSRAFPKERIEVFFDGKTARIDNWRKLEAWGVPLPRLRLPKKMDKGHAATIERWLSALRAEQPLLPADELLQSARWSIRVQHAARVVKGI